MNANNDKKQIIASTEKNLVAEEIPTEVQGPATAPANELRDAIDKLDKEMKKKLTNVIGQLVPGNSASLNTSVVKEISKIETRKNRLITGRLELLLRKGNPEAKEIVERLLAIAV